MPIYIEDEETTKLLDEYARAVKKTKTGALRDLLRTELPKITRKTAAGERLKRMRAFIKGYTPGPASLPNTKEAYDALYEYLADESTAKSSDAH